MKTALAPKLTDPIFRPSRGTGRTTFQWYAFTPQPVVVTVAVSFQENADTECPAQEEDNSDILTSRKIQQRVLDILDEPPSSRK